MKNLAISKNRVRGYLAEKLATNIINADIEDLILVLRYNALGGFEFLSDEDLFETYAATIPELSFVEITSSDENNIYLSVKKDYADEENSILVDIQRITQIH